MQSILQSKAFSHIGQVRKINQDAFYANDVTGFYIVADGMGGHFGGEVASALCIQHVVDNFKTNIFMSLKNMVMNSQTPEEIGEKIEDSIHLASLKIYEKSFEDPTLKGMGTTVVVGAFTDEYFIYAHVGDSRAYLLRNGFLYQLTEDHSLVQEQKKSGVPKEKQIPLKNILTRSVGYFEDEKIDVNYLQHYPGDFFFLTSDGLHNKVEETEMAALIQREGVQAVDKLIGLANARGGEDNCTIVVISRH